MSAACSGGTRLAVSLPSGADIKPADVVAHDEQDVRPASRLRGGLLRRSLRLCGTLLCLRSCAECRRRRECCAAEQDVATAYIDFLIFRFFPAHDFSSKENLFAFAVSHLPPMLSRSCATATGGGFQSPVSAADFGA